MIEYIFQTIDNLSSLPLPLFIFIGSFLEEIITPIPASAILTVSGTLIPATLKFKFIYVIWLSFLSAVGKTAGCYLLYLLAEKIGYVVVDKYGKYFGIKRSDIDTISEKISKGRKDDVGIFLLRALPMVPTAPVSLACGLLKTKKKTYIISTFWGNFVRSIMYLNIGIFGVKALKLFGDRFSSIEIILSIIAFMSLTALIPFLLLRKKVKK